MDEPINTRNEDSAEQGGQGPDAAADQEGIPAKAAPHEPGIRPDGEGESDMNDGRHQPDEEHDGKNRVGWEEGPDSIHNFESATLG